MLRSLDSLLNFTVHANDGEASGLEDVCIDKSTWDIRYLVLNTGNWLIGRAVLLSTRHLSGFDANAQKLDIDLSMADFEASPELKSTTELTRAFEERLFKHFGWGPYWPAPATAPTDEANEDASRSEPTFYTFQDIRGYEVVYGEQTLGWIKDVIYDDKTWKATSLIFDTGKTLREKIIEVKIERIIGADHEKKQFYTEMTRDEAENCEPFNLMALIQSQL